MLNLNWDHLQGRIWTALVMLTQVEVGVNSL